MNQHVDKPLVYCLTYGWVSRNTGLHDQQFIPKKVPFPNLQPSTSPKIVQAGSKFPVPTVPATSFIRSSHLAFIPSFLRLSDLTECIPHIKSTGRGQQRSQWEQMLALFSRNLDLLKQRVAETWVSFPMTSFFLYYHWQHLLCFNHYLTEFYSVSQPIIYFHIS